MSAHKHMWSNILLTWLSSVLSLASSFQHQYFPDFALAKQSWLNLEHNQQFHESYVMWFMSLYYKE